MKLRRKDFAKWLGQNENKIVGGYSECPLVCYIRNGLGLECSYLGSAYVDGVALPSWACKFVKAIDRLPGAGWRMRGSTVKKVLDAIK